MGVSVGNGGGGGRTIGCHAEGRKAAHYRSCKYLKVYIIMGRLNQPFRSTDQCLQIIQVYD